MRYVFATLIGGVMVTTGFVTGFLCGYEMHKAYCLAKINDARVETEE